MEKDGHDYYFTSKKTLKNLLKGEFLEHKSFWQLLWVLKKISNTKT